MKYPFLLSLIIFSSISFAQQGTLSLKGNIVSSTPNIEILNGKIYHNSSFKLFSVKELSLDPKHKILVVEYF